MSTTNINTNATSPFMSPTFSSSEKQRLRPGPNSTTKNSTFVDSPSSISSTSLSSLNSLREKRRFNSMKSLSSSPSFSSQGLVARENLSNANFSYNRSPQVQEKRTLGSQRRMFSAGILEDLQEELSRGKVNNMNNSNFSRNALWSTSNIKSISTPRKHPQGGPGGSNTKNLGMLYGVNNNIKDLNGTFLKVMLSAKSTNCLGDALKSFGTTLTFKPTKQTATTGSEIIALSLGSISSNSSGQTKTTCSDNETSLGDHSTNDSSVDDDYSVDDESSVYDVDYFLDDDCDDDCSAEERKSVLMPKQLHSIPNVALVENESEKTKKDGEYKTLIHFKEECDLIVQRRCEDPEKVKVGNPMFTEIADQEERNKILILEKKLEQLTLEVNLSVESVWLSKRNPMGATKSRKRNAMFIFMFAVSVGLSLSLFSSAVVNESVIIEEQVQRPIEMERTYEYCEVDALDTEQSRDCITEIKLSNVEVEKNTLKNLLAVPDIMDEIDLWYGGF